MKEKLDLLLREGAAKIEAAKTESELQEIKGSLLGKQGAVTELLKEIPKLDVSLRPEMGKAVNNVKNLLAEQIEGKREELKLKASEIQKRGRNHDHQMQDVRRGHRIHARRDLWNLRILRQHLHHPEGGRRGQAEPIQPRQSLPPQ